MSHDTPDGATPQLEKKQTTVATTILLNGRPFCDGEREREREAEQEREREREEEEEEEVSLDDVIFSHTEMEKQSIRTLELINSGSIQGELHVHVSEG